MGIAEFLGTDGARHRNRPPAWSDTPNTNPPLGTVGPNVANPGDIPADLLQMQAWDGWPDTWATPYYESGSDDWTGFGYGRQHPDGYLSRVSTVMTCVDRISSQLASFPVYGVRGAETVDLPSWSHNPEPLQYADWSDFVLAATNALVLDGETIVWATARYADGYPSRFVALPPRDVDVEPDGNGSIRYTFAGDDLDPADVCHVRYQVLPGRVRGVSPLEWLGRHLVSAAALETYAADIARHGVWAILKHPSNLSAKQTADAKAAWMAARRQNTAAPAVISGGFDFETLTLSPADMALLDLQTFDAQAICAAFRIPSYLVNIAQPGSMTYANAATLTDEHWRVGLRPLAKKIATALSAWALPGDNRLEFDRDEYIRPGPLERAQTWATLAAIGESTGSPVVSVDEIRIAERLRTARPQATGSGDRLIGANP